MSNLLFKIFAGIVLYNPDIDRLRKNIEGIRNQVQCVILLDNGSRNIDIIEKEFKYCTIIKNLENLGIANALNKLFERAKKDGAEWLITLDQDSIASDNLVCNYIKYTNKNIGILCPRIVDLNMQDEFFGGEEIEYITKADQVINSGSMISIKCWEDVGKYDERLFIDYVDTEFQERVLRSKKQIIRICNSVLKHEVGRMTEHNIGPFRILCSNHSAFRRYYMVRNRLYYRRKYFGLSSYIKESIRLLFGDIKIFIFEEDAINKIKASFRGRKDYRKLLNDG